MGNNQSYLTIGQIPSPPSPKELHDVALQINLKYDKEGTILLRKKFGTL